MSIDFNTAPEQRAFDLIPADTICAVKMTIRPGGHGEDKMLKRSKDGGCEMLDCEFVIVDGPYAGRKFWESLVLNGTTSGHAKAAEISRGRLRGILESARGIKRNDDQRRGPQGAHRLARRLRRDVLHRQDRHREGCREGERRVLARQEQPR